MNKNIPKTERTYKKSKPIDHLSSTQAISLMIKEQKDASLSVYKAMKSIEIATDKIYEHLKSTSKGRLIYAGAGTSGIALSATSSSDNFKLGAVGVQLLLADNL